MALLSSGEYKMVQKSVPDRKKMLLVKLTDSAQRALNDYIENQKSCNLVPSIEFNNNKGRILIPKASNSSSGEVDKSVTQFNFDVLSNQSMQDCYECLQHTPGSNQLTNLGPMSQRLRILANEDSYEKTKIRIAAIESEQRKNCTQEIDWDDPACNKKIRITRNQKTDPTPTSVPTKITQSVDHAESGPSSRLPKGRVRPVNNGSKISNPLLMKRPLRERLIHMLAVRPYKKPELLAALPRTGRGSDKLNLMPTLMSVSTMKDNTFTLMRSMWNDVQEDWPYYTDQEREQVKRNKPPNLTPPGGSDSGVSVSSNQSPNQHLQSGDKSPPEQYKRPGYVQGADGFQTKKARVSHFVKQDGPRVLPYGLGGKSPSKLLQTTSLNQIAPNRVTNRFDEVMKNAGLVPTSPIRKLVRPSPMDPAKPGSSAAKYAQANTSRNTNVATVVDKTSAETETHKPVKIPKITITKSEDGIMDQPREIRPNLASPQRSPPQPSASRSPYMKTFANESQVKESRDNHFLNHNTFDRRSSQKLSPKRNTPHIQQHTHSSLASKNINSHLARASSQNTGLNTNVRVKEEANQMNVRLKNEANHTNVKVKDEANHSNVKVKDEMNRTNIRVTDEANHSNVRIKEEMNRTNVRVRNEANHSNVKVKDEATHSNVRVKDETNRTNVRIRDAANHSNVRVKDEMNRTNVRIKEEANHSNVRVKDEATHSTVRVKDETNLTNVRIKDEANHSNVGVKDEATHTNVRVKDEANFKSPMHNFRESPGLSPQSIDLTTNSYYSNAGPSTSGGMQPKYMKDYVTITTLEQRRRYKMDFENTYTEYRNVHKEVDSVSNCFAQLGESLNQHERGTPEYERIEAEIVKKYNAVKSSKFQAAKRRFEYLHEKLSHIKRLVNDFDDKYRNNLIV